MASVFSKAYVYTKLFKVANYFATKALTSTPIGKQLNVRAFKGAKHSRFTQWLYASFAKINLDINQDLINLIARTRELAKNNVLVRSYLEMCEKNIIGRTGFILQSQMKKSDGTLDSFLNDELEWEWYEFGKLSNNALTVDGGLGHHEFDKLILRTLLIDGEVFIRVHKAKNAWGLSFELIDSMSIDSTKIREASKGQNAIVLRCRS